MDYNTLRTFADSWGLLAMALFFVFVILLPSVREAKEG